MYLVASESEGSCILRKEKIMSNQPENEQQSMTAEEVRQYILAELEAGKKAIAELSDEQLEEVAGGGRFGRGGGSFGHGGGSFAPGMGMPMASGGGSGTGAMLKQAAIWTVAGTGVQYGLGLVGSLFSGGNSGGNGGSNGGGKSGGNSGGKSGGNGY
jgi:hypothetical protein